MKQEAINFKQERDFGDLFNATFSFIGQEFKQLGTAILYFVVPFLLLSAIAATFYSLHLQQTMRSLMHEGNQPFAVFTAWSSIPGYVGIFILFSAVSTTMMFGTVYSYIKLYVEKGSGNFSLNDVWMMVTNNFLKIFLGLIVSGLIVGVGLVLCVIPGIYFWVALSILFCLMMFEEMNLGNSISRSMKLINKKWWFTFGLFLVTGIMLYILEILISIPSAMMGLKSIFTNFGQIKAGQNPLQNLSLGFYIVASITNLVKHLLTVIPVVLTAFLYFSLVEKIEKPSLIEKIDQIGADE